MRPAPEQPLEIAQNDGRDRALERRVKLTNQGAHCPVIAGNSSGAVGRRPKRMRNIDGWRFMLCSLSSPHDAADSHAGDPAEINSGTNRDGTGGSAQIGPVPSNPKITLGIANGACHLHLIGRLSRT
jgi:hypothetical protein